MNINNFVFLCVGNTAVLFDSLGGVVADLLRAKNLPAPVFGGSNLNITTKNIKNVVDVVRKEYVNKNIVIIDCTCSDIKNIQPFKNLPENILNENLITNNFVNQKIEIKQGKVNIANINYECGDYNILCETFCLFNNKILSIKFKDVLVLANRIVGKIYESFKI